MNKAQIIITIAVAIIGASGGIIAHMLYSSRLKKDLKHKSREQLIVKYLDAINKVRDIEKKANVIEAYDIVHPSDGIPKEINFNEHVAIYPSIMENRESWFAFYNEISKARLDYEEWLDCEVAVYLLYAERYYLALSQYVSKIQAWDELYTIGAIFILDIQRWQRKLDELLVKRLNSPKLKAESHTGRKWKMYNKRMEQKWKTTVLYNVLYIPNGQIAQICNVVLDNAGKIVE